MRNSPPRSKCSAAWCSILPDPRHASWALLRHGTKRRKRQHMRFSDLDPNRTCQPPRGDTEKKLAQTGREKSFFGGATLNTKFYRPALQVWDSQTDFAPHLGQRPAVAISEIKHERLLEPVNFQMDFEKELMHPYACELRWVTLFCTPYSASCRLLCGSLPLPAVQH